MTEERLRVKLYEALSIFIGENIRTSREDIEETFARVMDEYFLLGFYLEPLPITNEDKKLRCIRFDTALPLEMVRIKVGI